VPEIVASDCRTHGGSRFSLLKSGVAFLVSLHRSFPTSSICGRRFLASHVTRRQVLCVSALLKGGCGYDDPPLRVQCRRRNLPILPAFAGLPADEVKQDHPPVLGQKADTVGLDLPYRNISARLFKRGFALGDNVEIERTSADMMPGTKESSGHKIFLARRPNEPRFAPQQYYYAASKSGAVPSWAIYAQRIPADMTSKRKDGGIPTQVGGYGDAKWICGRNRRYPFCGCGSRSDWAWRYKSCDSGEWSEPLSTLLRQATCLANGPCCRSKVDRTRALAKPSS
jgi:hypothetical protein